MIPKYDVLSLLDVFVGGLLGFKINTINAIALHDANSMALIVKLKELKAIAKNGAMKFAVKSVTPLMRPLFSILVMSEKYAKQVAAENEISVEDFNLLKKCNIKLKTNEEIEAEKAAKEKRLRSCIILPLVDTYHQYREQVGREKMNANDMHKIFNEAYENIRIQLTNNYNI